MKSLASFSLKNGGSILVETENLKVGDGVVRAARPGEILKSTHEYLETALAQVQPVAGAIFAAFQGAADAPKEIEVEFGVTLSAEAGVIISSTGVEGNFKVTMRWDRDSGKA